MASVVSGKLEATGPKLKSFDCVPMARLVCFAESQCAGHQLKQIDFGQGDGGGGGGGRPPFLPICDHGWHTKSVNCN